MNDAVFESLPKQPSTLALPLVKESGNPELRSDRITRYINSDHYLENLQDFKENDRGWAIGLTVEYFILHPDGKDVDIFLDDIKKLDFEDYNNVNHRIIEAFTDSIKRRLHISDNPTAEELRAAYEYYVNNSKTNGVYYHGFNGVFEKSIVQNGLSLNERMWDWEELEEIKRIGEKRMYSMILGWGNINSKGKSSVAATARNAYRYAVASPEWFAQYVSEGFHIPVDPVKKQAYYRGDHDRARQNIVDLCDEWQSSRPEDIVAKKAYPNISDDDRLILLNFFEKYWQLFKGADSGPELALVQRSAIEAGIHFLSFDEVMEIVSESRSTVDLYDIIGMGIGIDGFYVDSQIRYVIESDKIEIVRLPDYNRVFPS